jgi:hypothetical protein
MDTGHVEGTTTKTRQDTDMEEGQNQEGRNGEIERLKAYVRPKSKARQRAREAGRQELLAWGRHLHNDVG